MSMKNCNDIIGIEPATFRFVAHAFLHVKGKFVPSPPMAHSGSRGKTPVILNLRARWWWVVKITPRPLYSPGPVWTIWWGEQSLAPAGIQTPDRHFIVWSLYRKLLLDIEAFCPQLLLDIEAFCPQLLLDIEAFCPQGLYVHVKMTVPLDNTECAS